MVVAVKHLHRQQLNMTGRIAVQHHSQYNGIEHIAVETDDYVGAVAKKPRAHPGRVAAEQ